MQSIGKKSVRVILLIFVLLLAVTVLSGIAAAHSGRTDSNGGHTDSSTGEYHYHHGYPAHQHEDLDGDGQLECPYEFVDRTGENSGSSSGGSKTTTTSTTKTVTVYRIPTWCKTALWILGAALCIAVLFNVSAARNLKRVERERASAVEDGEKMRNTLSTQCKTIRAERDHALDELDSVRRALGYPLDCFGSDYYPSFVDRYLYFVAGAASSDLLDSDGYPTGEKYIFYIPENLFSRPSRQKYHRGSCRYAAGLSPINAVTLKQFPAKYKPCAICKPSLPDTSWVDKYTCYKKLLGDYAKAEDDPGP